MSGTQAPVGLTSLPAVSVPADATPAPEAPARQFTLLGGDGMVCEGDVCYLPDPPAPSGTDAPRS